MAKEPEWTFFQGRHRNGKQVHEKLLIITNYPLNLSQNHTVFLLIGCIRFRKGKLGN